MAKSPSGRRLMKPSERSAKSSGKSVTSFLREILFRERWLKREIERNSYESAVKHLTNLKRDRASQTSSAKASVKERWHDAKTTWKP